MKPTYEELAVQLANTESKCRELSSKAMELVCEASLVYSKYNDTQMPDRDIVDMQTIQEMHDLCADVKSVDVVSDKVLALVAENGQMLRLLTDISENHLEYLSEGEDCMMAGVPLDYVSEINAYVSRDVEAENPFKETDAFLAEVRAQGVEMFAIQQRQIATEQEQAGDYEFSRHCSISADEACEFAEELREGKCCEVQS